MKWRALAAVVSALVLLAACRADTSGPTGAALGDSNSSPVTTPVCDIYTTLAAADIGLGESLLQNFRVQDGYAITWRRSMGELRLKAYEYSYSDEVGELIDATLILERSRIGLLKDAWTEREKAAGEAIRADAVKRCSVELDGGFLKSALLSTD